MLKKRIIPSLLFTEAGLVKGKNFNSSRVVGSILPSVKIYNNRDVDELILLDVEASKRSIVPNINILKEISKHCFVPLGFGGGINSIELASEILKYGADKIVLNTIAYKKPDLISRVAKLFGSQSIIISIDAKKDSDRNWICYSHSGTINTGYNVQDWVKKVHALGAGEILISSIDKDGTMSGYDLDLIKSVVDVCNIPVIASGGASDYKNLADAISYTGCSAVSASSMFHFTEQTPLAAKNYMHTLKIPVRNSNQGSLF